jgi:hypothetical protein
LCHSKAHKKLSKEKAVNHNNMSKSKTIGQVEDKHFFSAELTQIMIA